MHYIANCTLEEAIIGTPKVQNILSFLYLCFCFVLVLHIGSGLLFYIADHIVIDLTTIATDVPIKDTAKSNGNYLLIARKSDNYRYHEEGKL